MTRPVHSIPFAYAETFEGAKKALPGAGAAWLQTLREQSAQTLAADGLPTSKVEEWKYTNLHPLAALALRPAGAPDAETALDAASLPRIDGAHRLVFVNGRLRPDLGDTGPVPEGVEIASIARALDEAPARLEADLGQIARVNGHAVVNANTAFMSDGSVIRVAEGAQVGTPLHLVFVTQPGSEPLAVHPRNLLLAGAGSRALVVESHLGAKAGAYWSNPVGEVRVAARARLGHVKVQEEGTEAIHLGFVRAHVAEGAAYDNFVMTLGAALSRSELQVLFEGPQATARLSGAYLLDGRQHADHTTWIDHATPDCESEEVYKGVLDGHARSVFQGKISVRRAAQRTNGHQLNQTLLLSETAEVDTKPELEIYADDVKCSHGATAGELAEESLFYLRSRGIPEAQARLLLVRAFVEELVEGLENQAVREYLESRMDAWLEQHANQDEA